VQVGQVVGVDGVDPGVEPFAPAVHEHGRESADVLGQSVQVGAGLQDELALLDVVGVEVVGMTHEQSGQVPGRQPRGSLRSWSACAPGPYMFTDGLDRAGVSGLPDRVREVGGVGDALVPQVAQMVAVWGEDTDAGAVSWAGEDLFNGTGAGEAPHGAAGQVQLATDLQDRGAGGPEPVDRLVTVPRPGRQAATVVCPMWTLVFGRPRRLDRRLVGWWRGGCEAAAVLGDGLVDVVAEVVPQVPAIGHLDRLFRTKICCLKW
jgi:hypothetical protein